MKKIYTLVGFALIAGSAIAQAPYVVNGQYQFGTANTTKHAPNGITFIDMRDAAAHYQDRVDFYHENFDAGFNGWTPVTTIGPVNFEITNTGHANDAGSTFFIPPLATSTPSNWVLFDSDSDGSAGLPEAATLTSPLIDLTQGGTVTIPSALKLEFEQFYAGWQSDTLFLAISDDNGATWGEVEIMNNSVGREGRPNPEIVSINISSLITDPTQVRIRMRWAGNWDYGWQFDNIRIAELPDNDLTVTRVFRGDLSNWFMYSQVPQGQELPFVIGAEIKNIGFLNQTNVGFSWEIFSPIMVSLGSGTSTVNIPNLNNGQSDTVWVNTGITPSALGQYTINFTATATVADDDLSNNTMIDNHYWLTEYVYAADYGTPSAAFYNWAGNSNGAASIGNIFTIESSGVIGGVDIQLDNNVNVEDQLMFGALYLFDGATYVYDRQTPDYTTSSADNGAVVRLFFANPLSVVAGDAVMVVAGHYGGNPSAGFEMAGKVAQGSVVGTDGTGALVNLITPSAPVVRALMLDFTNTEVVENIVRFDVYPNPAVNEVNIALTMVNSQNTVINVLDITGKVVKTINVGEVNGDKNILLSVEDLNAGVYFIELVNNDGKQIRKFVKQ